MNKDVGYEDENPDHDSLMMMSDFTGPPRPQLDEAWHRLLSGTMIRFSAEELKLAGNSTSVRHKDWGYVGTLGVAHYLHCLVSS